MLKDKIVEAVRSVIGDAPAALHEPLFIGNEQKYVADCVAKNQVTQGEYVERFEQMLCDFTGMEYAVATSSGTAALHTAYLARGITQGVQAYVPSLTFIATANALKQTGARMNFYDGYLMCAKGSAVINVNLLGHITEGMDKPEVIHDSAQALGSSCQTKGVSVFSFNGNKIITTGQGGAIVTNFKEVADKARYLINQARIPHAWEINHSDCGFNYRMSNIHAALGCAQLEQLPYILKAKRALAQKYIEAFSGIDGVRVWEEPKGTKSNYWLVTVLLDNPAEQEPTLQALHDAGYLARKLPTPLHLLKPYKDYPRGDVSYGESLWRRAICLPSSAALGVKYA